MTELVYSILKELYGGLQLNSMEISQRAINALGATNKSEMNEAWNEIRSDGYLEPVNPAEFQNGLALQKISDHGRNVYLSETQRREDVDREQEEQKRIKSLASENLWYTTQNAKDAFDDYTRIKKNQNRAIGIALLSATIALIALLISIFRK